jgi:phosphoribosylformylglycinamidine cyclo-ligase
VFGGGSTLKYKDAGVNLDEARIAVERIKNRVRATFGEGVATDIGGFCGLFSTSGLGDGYLAATIDGVGTKLRIAINAGKHASVGKDLVYHSANDLVVEGAHPLFFLDYIGVGKLDSAVVEELVSGMADACKECGCALISGETAEMPGFYKENEYDLVGCMIGFVPRKRVVQKSAIEEGDKLIGLASNGLHTNGYSFAQKILFQRKKLKMTDVVDPLENNLQDELLLPHRLYLKPVLEALEKFTIKGLAHITGGGITGNLPRTLPEGFSACIVDQSWDVLPVFKILREYGKVDRDEMFRTFNMGVGLIAIVSPSDVPSLMKLFQQHGERPYLIGEVVKGDGTVLLK